MHKVKTELAGVISEVPFQRRHARDRHIAQISYFLVALTKYLTKGELRKHLFCLEAWRTPSIMVGRHDS